MKTKKNKIVKVLGILVLIVLATSFVLSDAPVLNIPDDTVQEDSGLKQYPLSDFVTDEDPTTLQFDPNIVETNPSVIDCEMNLNGPTLDCTTVTNQSGSNTVTVTVTDAEGLAASDLFTITVVQDYSDLPQAMDDNVIMGEDTTKLIDVLANDVDADGDPLTINSTLLDLPDHGTALVQNGQVNYTPTGNYFGPDSFVYQISDGRGGTASALVSITVNNDYNDAPIVNLSASIEETVVEGVAFNDILFLYSGVSDADNPSDDPVKDLIISTDPAWGITVAKQNALSRWKFSGTPTSQAVEDSSLSFFVSDGTLTSEIPAVTLTVKPALEIMENSVQIIINDGEGVFAFTDDDDDVNVSPGDNITLLFDYTNNYNKPLYNVKMELVRVNDDDTETSLVPLTLSRWGLSSGAVGNDDVETSLPFTVTEETYTLKLKMRGNSFSTLFEDSLEKTFEVVREDASAEITEADLSNSLACTRTANLEVEITNTGTNFISPELLVYKDAQTSFDEATGTFEDEELARVPFDTLPQGKSAEEQIALSFTPLEWTEGEHTLFTYLVDPNAEDPVLHSKEKDFTIGNCLVPIPAEEEFNLRVGETKEFRATPTELSAFKQFIRWYINDELQRNKNGQQSLGQRTFPVGENIVKAAIVQGGVTIDSVSWPVIVTNRPQTDELTLPNFDETKNPASYAGFTVENSNGKIIFNQAVNLLGILDNELVLDDLVTIDKIGSNPPTYLIAVDAAAAPGLAGRSATITLPSTFTNPLILRSSGFESGEFSECPATSCTGSNQNGKFVLTVPSFSTYVVMEEINAGLVVLPTELSFDNVNAGQTVNATITISNVGTVDALTGLTAQFVGVNASFNPQLTGLSATLNHGEQKQLQLALTIPAGETAGRHSIGTLRLTSSAGTVDVPLFINPKSFLTVKSVKVNGKSDGKFQLDEPTTVKVEVKNDHNQDLEDVQVTVTLKNINDEEVEEESDTFDLKEGKDDEVELSFDLRNEDVENEQFTMEIAVEGEDESGNVHRTVDVRTVQLDLENHNVIVKAVTLESASLQCQRQILLKVTVQNIGKSDENDVEIRVRNTALGLNMVKLSIDLDDFASEDNEHQAQGTINAEDAPAGLYPITVEVYRDGKLEDTEEVSLEVKTCGLPTTGTGAGTVQPPAGEQKKEVVIDVASQKLAEQLQQQLAARKAASEQPQPATITSFRESGMYLPLLGVFVALVFLAVVLGLVVLVTRK